MPWWWPLALLWGVGFPSFIGVCVLVWRQL